MIGERKLNFLMLDIILKDVLYCNNLSDEILDKMHKEYKSLRQEFTNQYKLQNFSKDPLRD